MSDIFVNLLPLLDSTLRVAVPLVLAALAGLFAERSGVVDIGLEGKMLGAAFAAATVAVLTGSAWLGLLAGIFVSISLAMVHGLAGQVGPGEPVDGQPRPAVGGRGAGLTE